MEDLAESERGGKGTQDKCIESNTRSVQRCSEAAVKVGEEMTDWFEVQTRVQQGRPMSPWLKFFNIYLDRVMNS